MTDTLNSQLFIDLSSAAVQRRDSNPFGENMKTILVISLGTQSDVLRSTVTAFRRDHQLEFDEVVVCCNQNLKSGEGEKDLARAIENAKITDEIVRPLFTENDDLLTRDANLAFFQMVYEELEASVGNGHRVIVNIAGGRKQMSALLLAAAYLAGANAIYHTHFEVGLDADGNKIETCGLIEIPHLRLGQLLRFVVGEIDLDRRFNESVAQMIDQMQTDEAFKILNGYLDEQARYRSLRDEFTKRLPDYHSMLRVSEMIVRDLIHDKLMFYPEYQRRVKNFDSFFQKVLRKQRDEGPIIDPFARFPDVAGLRVILFNSDDWRRAVEIVCESGDFVNFRTGGDVLPDDRSKRFGYRAIHLDACLDPDRRCHLGEYRGLRGVPCEIQFTTVFAHSWSRTHHVLSYKDNRVDGLTDDRRRSLDDAFEKAALRLEDIEDEITRLSNEFHPRKGGPKKEN